MYSLGLALELEVWCGFKWENLMRSNPNHIFDG